MDLIKQPEEVFNPADPTVVGKIIARTLLDQPLRPIGKLDEQRFYGSGVYALYYRGDFPAYKPIKGTSVPIYVGKVDPASHNAETPEEQGDKLWQRLVRDHAKNIRNASTTLKIEDFDCRYLVVTSAWQTTAETYLINLFKPIWNKEMKICVGFGKHGDDALTRGNSQSAWDTLHPGRKWATTEEKTSADKIMKAIASHYEKYPPSSITVSPLEHAPVSGDAPAGSTSGPTTPGL